MHPILSRTLAVCTVGILIFPVYAVSGGEPLVENLGNAVVLKNPELSGQSRVRQTTQISTEQILKAVPKPLPQHQPPRSNSTNQSPLANEVKLRMKMVLPTMPVAAANILPQSNPITAPNSAQSTAVSSAPGTGQTGITSNSCLQPNGFGPMLDCYYHPYTDTPGSYFPTYSTSYPWSAVGLLLFHDYDQSPDDFYHSCTATVISGPPNNLIVTAAHCIIDSGTGRSSKDFVFIPGSSNGSQPFGQFRYKFAMVSPAWISSKYSGRYDVALISLQDDASGNPISNLTGSMGMLINGSYIQNVSAIGYSVSEVPLGKWSTVSNAQTYQYNPKLAKKCKAKIDPTDLLLMGSGLTNGASGGPLINTFYPFLSNGYGNNLVTGTVHGNLPCGPMSEHLLWNVRFSDDNIGLLCQSIAGGCGQELVYSTLTVKVNGRGGLVSAPNGVLCGREGNIPYSQCAGSFVENSEVTLTAIPDREGYEFVGWSGACTGNNATCVLKIQGEELVTADFAEKKN